MSEVSLSQLRETAKEVRRLVSIPEVASWHGYDYGATMHGQRVRCPACPPSIDSGSGNKTVAVRNNGRTWKCYRCDAGGDVIDWIAAVLDCGKGRAILSLANILGVTEESAIADLVRRRLLAGPSPEAAEMIRRRDLAREWDTAWAKNRKKVKGRGFAKWLAASLVYEAKGRSPADLFSRDAPPKIVSPVSAILRRWLDGCHAPIDSQAACDLLQRKGFTLEDAERFGIVIAPRNRTRERSALRTESLSCRLVVPFFSPDGRLVSAAGRSLSGESPKWKTLPRNPAFDRNSFLFALDLALPLLRRRRYPLLVVEGYTDALALIAHEFPAVASMGATLDPSQARIIARVSRRVVLLPDADEAGTRGAQASRLLLRARGVEARIVVLGADADEFLARGLGAALEIESAVGI